MTLRGIIIGLLIGGGIIMLLITIYYNPTIDYDKIGGIVSISIGAGWECYRRHTINKLENEKLKDHPGYKK